ncbi:hypothetical protein ACLOJK_026070 [Asimina triloba]
MEAEAADASLMKKRSLGEGEMGGADVRGARARVSAGWVELMCGGLGLGKILQARFAVIDGGQSLLVRGKRCQCRVSDEREEGLHGRGERDRDWPTRFIIVLTPAAEEKAQSLFIPIPYFSLCQFLFPIQPQEVAGQSSLVLWIPRKHHHLQLHPILAIAYRAPHILTHSGFAIHYYRLGLFDNCYDKWNALFDCFNLKTKRSSEVQEILEARERSKTHIWTMRTQEEASRHWEELFGHVNDGE